MTFFVLFVSLLIYFCKGFIYYQSNSGCHHTNHCNEFKPLLIENISAAISLLHDITQLTKLRLYNAYISVLTINSIMIYNSSKTGDNYLTSDKSELHQSPIRTRILRTFRSHCRADCCN
uniref:SJCHGC03161 protein n=1 Tax=Schistosoma japonicum TaxID=6182 RepID=Q5D994_SCHJA|nr:SJCHGC03161 protein [Schistosoma japonicum]